MNIYGNPGNCAQIFTPYNPGAKIDCLSVEKFTKSLDNSEELSEDIGKILGIIDKLLYVKYDNIGLKAVLEHNLKQPSKSLAELNRKVLVTTFQLDNTAAPKNQSWRPLTLDNLPNNLFDSQDTLILDAALCTSAAPTYFPPYQHPSYGLCIDGGVFANNPSTLALARVLGSGILGERKIQNIRMLSIGTGIAQNYLPPSYQPHGPLRYGPTTWFWPEAVGHTPGIPLLSILSDGSSIIDDFQAEMLLGEQQYQRINVQLQENIPLDGCSKIEQMRGLVHDYFASPEWKKKIEWVQNNF